MSRRNIIGPRVKHLRNTSIPPITQQELIARLQVLGVLINQSTLSKIETGSRPVTDIEVIAFAEALKVPVSSLFESVDEKEK